MENRERQKKTIPTLTYPDNLPITHRRLEIIESIQKHQVVILSGETGSGKTTQIPKMCIEAGRGVRGLIGCTQPRRIAALTVAARVGEEIGKEGIVGCKIRFHDSCSSENLIRVMTDGILLSEIQSQTTLRAYDTIMIDEAHERSLNIDVLLGMMRRLINKRRDLKLIMTSATLDTRKFSEHFHNAPIIEVSGRTYPVEIYYQPPDENHMLGLAERSALGVRNIVRESRWGDMLVFLPTEQDILDTMELVTQDFGNQLNILPMFARLPASEQRKAFELGGKRKLVIATNVAETSLTIPGIRYVVDSGLARISRYNPGTGTRGLPILPISRASADQRAGRCGRVEDGICIRLYSEEDYLSRSLYTPPEIKRTNLAEVILRLIDIGIDDIENFPFVDPPASAGIKDGLRTLREVGALNSTKDRHLTPIGRLMARLPLDPRLSRMLIHAEGEACLGDVLPIVAALSLQDPREKPPDQSAQAESAHAVFCNEYSDFIGWLNIWDGFRTRAGKGAFSGKLKRYCREHYLSFRRMREWMDVHRQIALVMEDNGYKLHRKKHEPWIDKNGAFTQRYASLHRSILSGLLSHIARLEERGTYKATRSRTVFVHPGSALRNSSHRWIVAAELMKTSRLFARSVGAIDPMWLEDIGAHLTTKNWINPHWNQKKGAVMAEEHTRLFCFLIAEGKMVPYGPIAPRETREIFIRCFLVEMDTPDSDDYMFLKSNKRLIQRLKNMESKLRRKDIVAGEDALYSFYEQRLPSSILDIATLNRELKVNNKLEHALCITESDLLTGIDVQDELRLFPDKAVISGESWFLSYTFDTQSKHDGVTLQIPSGRLSEVKAEEVDWIVPGLLKEKIEAMMKGLPKNLRRRLIPVAETAGEALKGMSREGNVSYALSAWLYRERGIDVPPNEWDLDNLPNYLKVRFSLLDDRSHEVAAGYDPAMLEPTTRADGTQFHSSGRHLTQGGPAERYREKHEQSGLKEWPDELPVSVEIGGKAVLWPTLKDDGDSVSLRFYDDKRKAMKIQAGGQQKLALFHWEREIGNFRKQLFLTGMSRVTANFLGGAKHIEDAIWQRVISDVFSSKIVRTKAEWMTVLEDGGKQIFSIAENCFELISSILMTYREVNSCLEEMGEKSYRKKFIETCSADARSLISRNFIEEDAFKVWKAIPRWLRAVEVRGRRGVESPAKEQRFLDSWNPLNDRLIGIIENLSVMASDEKKAMVDEAKIMMEELRVALSAVGEIKPVGKISESRMKKTLDTIERML